MKFFVIGITDHPEPFFPPEVIAIISQERVFSGGRRHHAIVAPLLPEGSTWIDITVPLSTVFLQYRNTFSNTGGTVVVFASGDPLFFGFANTILREMPEAEVELFPTFNALQMLAHRLLIPYHDMHVVSLTGRPWPALDAALIERTPMIGILTDREHTPAAIARRMTDYGYTDYTMHVGEHLGNPETEHISTLSLANAARQDFRLPNCVILKANTPGPQMTVKPFGLPDSSFKLLDGREKMITKMPIRLLTLQALGLAGRHVLWDVGFCTGSISIEARLLFPHVKVVAFEVRPECEAIIHTNARRHGTPGIEVHMGDFLMLDCSAISASSPPDAVFIGGHGGRLKAIMQKVLRYLAPDGVIVMNSVTSAIVDQATNHRASSRQLWDEACQELGLEQEQPLHIQLDNYNPIEILKCRR